ncbi:MAG: acyl carrier protein [Cellvibrionaceae bacterium]
MSENTELFEKIKNVIKENSSSDNEIGTDDLLLQTGAVDSYSILQIFLGLQSETGADIEIEDITEENFASVRTIAELIESRK